jgi:hypothetical protein
VSSSVTCMLYMNTMESRHHPWHWPCWEWHSVSSIHILLSTIRIWAVGVRCWASHRAAMELTFMHASRVAHTCMHRTPGFCARECKWDNRNKLLLIIFPMVPLLLRSDAFWFLKIAGCCVLLQRSGRVQKHKQVGFSSRWMRQIEVYRIQLAEK